MTALPDAGPQAPAPTSPGLSRTGDFDSAALSSAREVDPAQWASDEPILGLHRESGYVWGTLRGEDGHVYSVMRRIPQASSTSGDPGDNRSLGGRLIVLATVTAEGEELPDLRVRKEPKDAPHSESLVRVGGAGGVRFTGAAAHTMCLEMDRDRFDYREESVLELVGERRCPGLQWYVPGPEAALLYLTQTWEVSGTVLGRSVEGFLFWEEAYMPPGGRLYAAKDPLEGAAYTSWYSWATRWDDGSTEVGHFLLGGRSFGVGVHADSHGRVRSARRVSGTITRAEDGYWHDGIDYDLDGEAWHLTADPRGRMQLGPVPNPQQEGVMRRAVETRTPFLHMAWGETVPGRLHGR